MLPKVYIVSYRIAKYNVAAKFTINLGNIYLNRCPCNDFDQIENDFNNIIIVSGFKK